MRKDIYNTREHLVNIYYNSLVNGIKNFGSSSEDICKQILGLSADKIHEKVIIAPWWEPEIFPEFKTNKKLANGIIKIWNIRTENHNITYIKTGIGAPVITDVVLTLGLTKCKSIIFIGSVGSLDESIFIGDIVIPEYSICGDGVSRYLKGSPL